MTLRQVGYWYEAVAALHANAVPSTEMRLFFWRWQDDLGWWLFQRDRATGR